VCWCWCCSTHFTCTTSCTDTSPSDMRNVLCRISKMR
jgi:hypothetical protein